MHSFVIGPDAFDVVVVSGKDAERFLQGQLTCNVAELANGQWVHGACCNNKGRVIAAFVLVRHRDNFYLCMTRGVAQLLVAALQKFIPFYKCTMDLQPGRHHLYGLTGECAKHATATATAMVPGGANTLLYPPGDDEGWLCLLDGSPRCALWWSSYPAEEANHLADGTVAGSREQWESLALLRGHYPFGPQDSGEHSPQDLNFDHSGYVSFNKGCYTGQEIVARMHYRGKPKKQLCLLRTRDAHNDGAKLSISDASGLPVGTLLLTRPLGSSWLVLAQIPADFSEPFDSLLCAGRPVIAGSAFDGKVIQSSPFFSS